MTEMNESAVNGYPTAEAVDRVIVVDLGITPGQKATDETHPGVSQAKAQAALCAFTGVHVFALNTASIGVPVILFT